MVTLGLQYVFVSVLVALFLLVCVVLILTVLIQKPQGGGLSGAFGAGGGGAGQTAFGTKTGDALTIATISMFVIYLAFAVGLNFAARPENIERAGGPTLVAPEDASESVPLPEEVEPGEPVVTPEQTPVPVTEDPVPPTSQPEPLPPLSDPGTTGGGNGG